MRTLFKVGVPTTVGALIAVHTAVGQTSQPRVPRQFTPVAEANWTTETPLVGRELECRGGKVRIFDCQNINLLAFIPARALGDSGTWGITDVWGWTDPATGREFVLAGRETGTAFVETTDPVNPRYLGSLPLPDKAKPSRWRSINVYKHYAFIVADQAGPHGVQVFDLTQLRDVKSAPTVFRETARYDRFSSAHSIAIDTVSGFAYALGLSGQGETCGTGLHIIDIRTPTAPAFAGCYLERFGVPERFGVSEGYINDAQCVIYHGPDQEYQGRQVCFGSAGKAFTIVDVTDKQKVKRIGIKGYLNKVFVNQGWLTEDHRYFFLNDDLDEFLSDSNPRTRTLVFDISKLSKPVVAKEFWGTTGATDYKLFIRGRYVYQSNLRAGLRVLDAGDPTNPKEVAYFDTAPAVDNTRGFGGSGSNYPYFKDGVIAVSNYMVAAGRGLYILRYRPAASAR